ncbi:MAG: tRNA (uridine(54)-C5)-methyltransferase TrmA [Halioglobus sp.]
MPLSNVLPAKYTALLAQKCAQVESMLAPFGAPGPNIFASSTTGFRMRAEFRLWHDGDKLDYVMYHRDAPKTPVPITDFPIGCEKIQQLMPVLLEKLHSNDGLRHKLFQVEFLCTLSGEALITLIYHRKLASLWEAEARTLAQQLGVQIIGRSRKQKVVLDKDYVTEILSIDGREYHYRQYEQAFTQPNAGVNIHMIEWAGHCAEQAKGDLLELYCGNGNFTLPLSRHFQHVIATELSKTSIRAARENLEINGIANVEMIRLSAEEVTEAMNGTRVFRRLAQLPKPLTDYQLDTVFVDPPRAGLDEQTEAMVSKFNAIIYISCNPETLARNLKTICVTHEIKRFALFDQFPYTHHMECGVFLQKR